MKLVSPRRSVSVLRPRGLAVPVIAVAFAVSSGTAAATTVPDDSVPDEDATVVVLDEGKGDERYNLQPPMVAGTVAHLVETTTTGGTIQLTGTQSLDETIDAVTTIEQSADVVSVDADGGYTVLRTVDSFDFVVNEGTEDIADGFKNDEELEFLVGLDLTQTYDADGRLLSITPPPAVTITQDQQAAIDTLIEEGGDRPPFPDLEVGVGAVWTAELPGTSAAGGAARYELVSIEDRLATIEITFDGDSESLGAILPPAFDEITGEFAGQGTLTANIDNQLASTLEFNLQMDVTMTGAPGEMTMDIDSTSTQVVTIEE